MDYSPEYVRSALRNGQSLTTVFAPICPSPHELDGILTSLSLGGGGALFVGVKPDQSLTLLQGPAAPSAVAAMEDSATRLRLEPFPSVNAVNLEGGWVAYCAFDEDEQWVPCFDGLTVSQARLLLALVRESNRGHYRPTVVAYETLEGWSLNLSTSSGSESADLKGDFDEIDLHALRDEGYVTLLVKPGQYDLSVKPRALRSVRDALERRAQVRKAESPQESESRVLKDVFICHAGPDKSVIVSPLVAALESAGVTHWHDDGQIRWGDSLIAKVNEGLRASRYVLVVLSPSFPGRPWPERELNAALGLEAQSGESRVLPLLAGSQSEIQDTLKLYPLLADKKYLTWTGDPSSVIVEIRQVLKRP